MARNDEYLGDGLYARYNGQEIWLRAGDSEVCLDTGMLKQLQRMVENYEQNQAEAAYERQQEEGFRGGEYAASVAAEQARVQRELKR